MGTVLKGRMGLVSCMAWAVAKQSAAVSVSQLIVSMTSPRLYQLAALQNYRTVEDITVHDTWCDCEAPAAAPPAESVPPVSGCRILYSS